MKNSDTFSFNAGASFFKPAMRRVINFGLMVAEIVAVVTADHAAKRLSNERAEGMHCSYGDR